MLERNTLTILCSSLLLGCTIDVGVTPSSTSTFTTHDDSGDSGDSAAQTEGGSDGATSSFTGSTEGGESSSSSDEGGGSTTGAGSSTGSGVTCATAPAGMQAWWRGEGDTLDHEGAHDAVPTAGFGYAAGEVGQAMSLNGATAALAAPNTTLLPIDDFSLEVWIRTTPPADLAAVVSTYECGGTCPSMVSDSQYFLYVNSAGVLAFSMRDRNGVFQQVVSTSDVADGQFHHVVAVRDVVGGTMRLYVDGGLESSDPLVATGMLSDEDGEMDPLIIGAQYGVASTTLERFFVGEIDELTVYTTALDDATVTDLFDAGEAGKCVP